MLKKHEVVLAHQGNEELGADFWESENAGGTYVWLPREKFLDMGSPTEITVTVVPGDALNEDDA